MAAQRCRKRRWRQGGNDAVVEAAAVITVLVLLGQVLELRARESTSGALRALLDWRQGGNDAVDPGGAGSQSDQGEHIEVAAAHRSPGALEEWPAGPEHHWGRQHKLQPVGR
jgi:cation transport ATPase